MVRLWYRTTAAYQQREEELDPGHLNRGLAIFPTDPEILFFNACLHETYASPAAYSALRVPSLPTGLRLDIGSVGSELHQAERLFRQTLAQQPSFAEARLRLGRVLGLGGRHQEAVEELRRALADTEDPLLVYYGNLFLGAEENALDHTDAARTAFRQAAALFPLAQSPHFGLSQLAHRSRDRAAALEAIEPVLALPAAGHERPDPWWDYHISQGRTADERLDALYKSFTPDDPK
jgi:tetratricopeptide (TPR) repeat protein